MDSRLKARASLSLSLSLSHDETNRGSNHGGCEIDGKVSTDFSRSDDMRSPLKNERSVSVDVVRIFTDDGAELSSPAKNWGVWRLPAGNTAAQTETPSELAAP